MEATIPTNAGSAVMKNRFYKSFFRLVCFIITINFSIFVFAQSTPSFTAASEYTQQLNQSVLRQLPFNNKNDFNDSEKNLIGRPENLMIQDSDGKVVWNMDQYTKFQAVGTPAPPTVNPSLWRQAQLNTMYGLYKVTDHIYQVRGYDLSVMSIIEGKTGYIIVDPLVSKETAKAAIDLVYKYLSKKPIKAVIYTHSHIDHFGGVKGVITEEEVKNGNVQVIAPRGFLDAAISENVIAGNVMARRASYMYGNLINKDIQGQVDGGLGKTTSSGTTTLIVPTTEIDKTPTDITIDGVKFVFQYTPNTEAPAEMNFYLPQFHALCMAENATHTLHNLYTLRGAEVRDAKSWSTYLNQSIELFGKDAEVEFASHHWPMWGNQNIIEFLKKQRDIYKYINDQTLRLANEGYTMNQIAEMIKLPKSLADEWYNRGYYGSVSHNVKAVYQKYLGWFDGNPANLHPLPTVEESKKFVEYMGGASAILEKAKKDFAAGHYRWVAEVLNKVVFADPNNQQAKNLLADAYDQLGYQTENATWRNFYLTGALELRNGVNKNLSSVKTASADILKSMPLDLFFDFLAIHLNGQKADGKKIVINWIFPDINKNYITTVENSVMNYEKGTVQNADATITIDRADLDRLILGKINLMKAKEKGDLKIDGNSSKVTEFFSFLDKFNFWFNIVTPQPNSP